MLHDIISKEYFHVVFLLLLFCFCLAIADRCWFCTRAEKRVFSHCIYWDMVDCSVSYLLFNRFARLQAAFPLDYTVVASVFHWTSLHFFFVFLFLFRNTRLSRRISDKITIIWNAHLKKQQAMAFTISRAHGYDTHSKISKQNNIFEVKGPYFALA